MEPLLYLTHRIPFPPNKGDKITTFHMLRHLARSYRVYLGTFVDDPADDQHRDAVRDYCADVFFGRINRRAASLRSLLGFFRGEPLNLAYYRDPGLAAWAHDAVTRHGIRKMVVYAAPMAQYVMRYDRALRLMHFADVDSQKWARYGATGRWPASMVYRREGDLLLQYERRVATAFDRSFFVTPAELQLFATLAPECAGKIAVLANGVDCDYFSPDVAQDDPYPKGERAVVFTGAMDYPPNVDAVTWFARECLPELRSRNPQVRFYIVGMNPTREVQQLAANPAVVVTGRVPDVRPYLRHAAVAVAPLRLARGIQNKVLEAMAMARPVVTSSECAKGLSAVLGEEVIVADEKAEWIEKVAWACGTPEAEGVGRAARLRVLADYAWEAHLRALDTHLEPRSGSASNSGEGVTARLGVGDPAFARL